jgi:hypothetical protein
MLNVEGINSVDFIKRLSKAKQPFDILRFSILRFCGSLFGPSTHNPGPFFFFTLSSIIANTYLNF